MAQAAVVVLDEKGGLLGLFANKEVAAHSIRFSYHKMEATFHWDGLTTYVAAFAKDSEHVEHRFTVREQVVHEQVEHL